jgi:hypothetical protein
LTACIRLDRSTRWRPQRLGDEVGHWLLVWVGVETLGCSFLVYFARGASRICSTCRLARAWVPNLPPSPHIIRGINNYRTARGFGIHRAGHQMGRHISRYV